MINIEQDILNIANLQINKLQKKYPVSYKKIKIILDEKSEKDIGSGYFKGESPATIFIVLNYFREKEKLNRMISKTVAHEFCHLYINDKKYLDGGRLNKDIEKEVHKLIDKYNIKLIKKVNDKLDISKLISDYADKNANINCWHEVLCEAFSLYESYDYIENNRFLIPEAYNVHKDLVDFLINYKIIETSCIDELDIDYYM